MREPIAAQLAEIAALEAKARLELTPEESDRLKLLQRRQYVREWQRAIKPAASPEEARAALLLRRNRARIRQWRATEELDEIARQLDGLRQTAGLPVRARGGAAKRMDEIIRLTRRRAERGLSVEESERLGALMAIVRRKPCAEIRVKMARLKAEFEIYEDVVIGRAGRVDYDAPVLELIEGGDGWSARAESTDLAREAA